MTLAKASKSMSHQEQGVTHTRIHHPRPAHGRGALPWEELPADKVPAAGLSRAGPTLSLLRPRAGRGWPGSPDPRGSADAGLGGSSPACSLLEHQPAAWFVPRLCGLLIHSHPVCPPPGAGMRRERCLDPSSCVG